MYRKFVIESKRLPPPAGAYSHGIVEMLGDRIYVARFAGLVGVDPRSRELVREIEPQTRQALGNMEALLDEMGLGVENLSKVHIYLSNYPEHFPVVDKLYGLALQGKTPPARVCIGVASLPKGALLELDCDAGGTSVRHDALRELPIL